MRLCSKIENFLTDHVLRMRQNWPMLLQITRSVWTGLKQAKIKVAFTQWHINLCKMVIYLLKNIAKMALLTRITVCVNAPLVWQLVLPRFDDCGIELSIVLYLIHLCYCRQQNLILGFHRAQDLFVEINFVYFQFSVSQFTWQIWQTNNSFKSNKPNRIMKKV